MKKKTPLEKACKNILGEKSEPYYNILSNLVILNPEMIKEDDERLSAKITAILVNEKIKDKAHMMCLLIEDPELKYNFKEKDISYAKQLLEMDPELQNTKEIINDWKKQEDPNYSEIMRKVPLKYTQKLYYQGETRGRRRI